jgi:hypothetical protein
VGFPDTSELKIDWWFPAKADLGVQRQKTTDDQGHHVLEVQKLNATDWTILVRKV